MWAEKGNGTANQLSILYWFYFLYPVLFILPGELRAFNPILVLFSRISDYRQGRGDISFNPILVLFSRDTVSIAAILKGAFNPILVLFSHGVVGILYGIPVHFQSYIGSIFSISMLAYIYNILLSILYWFYFLYGYHLYLLFGFHTFNPILVLFSRCKFHHILITHTCFQSYIGSIFSSQRITSLVQSHILSILYWFYFLDNPLESGDGSL